MKANELRIGNIIDPNIIIGSMVERAKMGAPNGSILVTPDILFSNNSALMTGIPLTEEWLIKFGFIIEGSELSVCLFKGSLFGISKRENKYFLSSASTHCTTLYTSIEIKYVHQLQNLYFSLTGEELNEIEVKI